MKCPSCGSLDLKVVDSRPSPENNSIRRRRECEKCHLRFTTYEIIDAFQPVVIKKDGSKEYFDRNKLLSGILKACQKRPVDADKVTSSIEAELINSLKREVSTDEIGNLVMEKLRELDDVAYVRYASVHREFKDVDSFMREIEHMKEEEQQK